MPPFFADFVAGWVGGILGIVTGYPFDTIKVRQQTFSLKSSVAIRETLQYDGVLGFFKGMTSPLVAYGPSDRIHFGSTSVCMRALHGEEPYDKRNKPLYLFNYFISGCVGGTFHSIVMCPVELVKISLQTSTEGMQWAHNMNAVKFEGTAHTFRTIVHIKGYRGLYRGFVPMMFRDIPTSGIYFVVYEALLPDKEVKWYHKTWAASWAGIASVSSVLPADLVKTKIQTDDILYPIYTNCFDCVKKLYKERGLRYFWTGLPIITIRSFPAHAMFFIGYDMTIDFIGKYVKK